MKTSLGIWAFGPMITRFVPVGYQPEHANETTAERVRRAVEGLGAGRGARASAFGGA